MKNCCPFSMSLCLIFSLSLVGMPLTEKGLEAAGKPVLHVYNWSEYIALDGGGDAKKPLADRSPTLRAFVAQNNCNVEYSEYDDEEDMWKKVQNVGAYYDVLGVSQAAVKKLKEAGMIEEITLKVVPNKVNIAPRYVSIPGDREGKYFVPYLAGTTGIAYRRDLLGTEVTSWKQYFEPDEKLKGKIGAMDTADEMFMAAMKYLGIDPDTADPGVLKTAAKAMIRLKREGYWGLVDSNPQIIAEKLKSGEIAMAIMYSGDAISAAEEDHGNIAYAIPKEGAEYYIDTLVVPKNAPHKDLAMKFVNFMLSPEIHAQNAIYVGYACPNEKAMPIVREKAPDQISDPRIYPHDDILRKCSMADFSRFDDIDRLWSKIRE